MITIAPSLRLMLAMYSFALPGEQSFIFKKDRAKTVNAYLENSFILSFPILLNKNYN